jgi:phosphohistidine swiveling domain-containing protein
MLQKEDVMYTMPLDDKQAVLETVGGKGASLARLAGAGLPVPDGFHVTTAAYRYFVAENDLQSRILAALQTVDVARPSTLEFASRAIEELFLQGQIPQEIAGAISQAYAQPAQPVAVAVRSSATAEDLPDLSFAGQQETFLNVRGVEALLEAVKRCWASLWTARAIGYRVRHGIDQDAVSLAVVVQALVPAEAAGILFTANPLSGSRDEMVINAAWGLGEAVVGGLVSPDTIVADKASGKVKQVEVADKATMTVLAPDGTAEQPVPKAKRGARVLSDAQVAELVRLGRQIEDHYGAPQDIEWALALPSPAGRGVGGEGRCAILQSRPITALPELEAAPPTKWKLPKNAYIAMRNNIVELMAEPLSPLFGTLGLAAVNASMGRLLSDFFGRTDIMPAELIITVNEYAYYNGSISLVGMGRMLLGSVGIMRRMFTGAVERWTKLGRPRYVAAVERWQAVRWRDLPATEILDAVRELAEAAIDAYGALVGGVIPAAWITEGLFTAVYNTLIKRRSDPPAAAYLLGFDSIPILATKSLYDLAEWARTRDGLAAFLLRTPTAQIAAQGDRTPPDVDEIDWRGWRARFQAHLQRYGHTIYNLDFANPVPADAPAPLLEACKLFLSGQGTNPHVRQQVSAEQREQATQAVRDRVKGLRLRWFAKFLGLAQKYAPLREDGLAEVGLSYPLLRRMLHELGQRFVQGRMITEPDDIYWLIQDEVGQGASRLDRGEALDDLSATVPQRRAIWDAARRAVPPMALPTILGKDIAQLKKGRGRKGNTLKGVAASPGTVAAAARVLHGPEDFEQMRPGDVLVAAITTPAWTPLFAMASAVVTDVGGPLSHGSIVAREYGIPAVLGTGVATRRIKTGDRVRVDGERGRVEILES